jgi:hypothetical protein
MTRGFRSVALRRGLLNPARYGFYSVILLSHKVLRRLVPLLALPLLGSTLVLASVSQLYALMAAGQIAFYSLALAGFKMRRHPAGRVRWLSFPFYFCMAHLAALIALGNFLRGERVGLWEPQRNSA